MADEKKDEIAGATGSDPPRPARDGVDPSFDVGLPHESVAALNAATLSASLPTSQPIPAPQKIPPSEPDSQPSPTKTAPAPLEATPLAVSTGGDMRTDIEKILREVKLPERRGLKMGADQSQHDQPGTGAKSPLAEPPQEAHPDQSALVKPQENLKAASVKDLASSEPPAISSVHTLKDDLQHVVKEKKISLVRAVSLEQERKSRGDTPEVDFGRTERRKRAVNIVIAVAVLFLLGSAALFGVYVVMLGHSATSAQQSDSLVFVEQSVALPLESVSPTELKRRIAAARQTQGGSLGSITGIVPITQSDTDAQPRPATLAEFFAAIGAGAPDELMRALGSKFFFGLHVVDENAPVLIISVVSYDHAFAGMLAWEPTMNAGLSPAFTPVPAVVLDANNIPSERTFKDSVMRNYDVRELKDDAGQIQLYYSFPSPNLLVIAESPYSFPELLSRLQSVRRL